jgi:hypothetical protein
MVGVHKLSESRNFPPFLEPWSSLPCLQPATDSFHEPDDSSSRLHTHFHKINFNIIMLSAPRSPERYFPSRLSNQMCARVSYLSHSCYISHPRHSLWIERPNNICWRVHQDLKPWLAAWCSNALLSHQPCKYEVTTQRFWDFRVSVIRVMVAQTVSEMRKKTDKS